MHASVITPLVSFYIFLKMLFLQKQIEKDPQRIHFVASNFNDKGTSFTGREKLLKQCNKNL